MYDDAPALSTFDHLSDYVRNELCDRDALDRNSTPFHRTRLIRRGDTYGYVFHVVGPRMLRTSAVWSIPDDAIVFYNSTGQRVKEVRLAASPALAAPLAKAA
jgi:hypothetical protein